MKKILVVVLLGVLALPIFSSAAKPGEDEMLYPDLLGEADTENIEVPDLLGDPYVPGPVRVMGNPIFEDDFYFNRPEYLIRDPLEPMNRVFFVINDRLYFWVLKPVKTGYAAVLPRDVRGCIENFFDNISSPIRFVNNVLQGEMDDAGVVLGRFVINSTLGVFGLGDPAARDFNLEPRKADLGQTFGKWGFGEGVYLFWPLLGPSSVRDTVGFVGDIYLHPLQYMDYDTATELGYVATDRVNSLSLGPDVYEELKRISLDPYVASRQAYYEYRRNVIESK